MGIYRKMKRRETHTQGGEEKRLLYWEIKKHETRDAKFRGGESSGNRSLTTGGHDKKRKREKEKGE